MYASLSAICRRSAACASALGRVLLCTVLFPVVPCSDKRLENVAVKNTIEAESWSAKSSTKSNEAAMKDIIGSSWLVPFEMILALVTAVCFIGTSTSISLCSSHWQARQVSKNVSFGKFSWHY